MANVFVGGPEFQIESDKALLVLGHSERKEVGDFLARTLDERGIFEYIDTITLNECVAKIGQTSLLGAMKTRTVITHSASVKRIPEALQIIAINPPEPLRLGSLLKRAFIDIGKDQIIAEDGAHKTGFADMMKAGLELARNPRASYQTTVAISRGYSTVEHLSSAADDFRAGRAIVHSDHDSFGFAELADIERASSAGVTTVVLPDHYHNEVLFAPNRTLDLLTPVIFPQTNTQERH